MRARPRRVHSRRSTRSPTSYPPAPPPRTRRRARRAEWLWERLRDRASPSERTPIYSGSFHADTERTIPSPARESAWPCGNCDDRARRFDDQHHSYPGLPMLRELLQDRAVAVTTQPAIGQTHPGLQQSWNFTFTMPPRPPSVHARMFLVACLGIVALGALQSTAAPLKQLHSPLSCAFHLLRHSRVGSSSGSGVSCGGRSSSGTLRRFTRMRVHVDERPRMESTSTSSTASCAAASGWRAFQRSSPASAASLLGRVRDGDERHLLHAAPAARASARRRARCALRARRRDARRLARHLAEVRRPRRVAEPRRLVARRELEQRLERARRARRWPRGGRRAGRTARARCAP